MADTSNHTSSYARGPHPSQRRYPPELRDRAVRMVLDTIEQTGQRAGVITRIARQLGIGTESLRSWLRQAEVDGGRRPGLSTPSSSAWSSWNARTGSCAGPTTSSRQPPVSSRGSSTRDRRGRELQRRPPGQVGVEPICRVPKVAPSTSYAARCRPPSARACRDAELKEEVTRVYKDNFRVYGAAKVWRQLQREGIVVGRDRIARLVGELGIAGVVRGSSKRTTIPAAVGDRPADLVERNFTAREPNRLWVTDLTDVATWAGFCYVAFVIDAFSRMIVGWRVSTSLRTELALDALEMAIWTRQGEALDGLVHHSDRGVQYLAIRYTERLAEAGAIASVGSRGDSYDNALAETVNGLFKAELIRRQGPWRTADQVELATLAWVDWWTRRRLHGAVGDVPAAEYEAAYYHANREVEEAA